MTKGMNSAILTLLGIVIGAVQLGLRGFFFHQLRSCAPGACARRRESFRLIRGGAR